MNATASDISRYNLGSVDARDVPKTGKGSAATPALRSWFSTAATSAHMAADRWSLRAKVIVSMVILVELLFLSLGIMGAAGQNYAYSGAYATYDPVQVARVIFEHARNFFGPILNICNAHDNTWIMENVPGYWAIWRRAGVLGITLACSVLLGISGMLYQNVFKNPIAGPGMLGASTGISLAFMLMVVLYGSLAPTMLAERYLFCYGFGAGILVFVILAGKRLSGKGRPFDVVTMLLVGSILSQLLGFIVSYVTLFVMEDDDYLVFYNLSQMLTVDSSLLSWVVLAVAFLASFVPVWLLRFKLNALSFDEDEMRMMGVSPTLLRAVALICGAIMMLAAQIHVGMVSLVTLIVPFLARSWFGVEARQQMAGCICIGAILLIVARDVTDLIPFVGNGLAIGSIMSVIALPLLVVVMSRQMRE